ncbi:MAG: hypothetical protein WC752_03060 [Patescibacteria group bacterium]|jgi:hypothetical protein
MPRDYNEKRRKRQEKIAANPIIQIQYDVGRYFDLGVFSETEKHDLLKIAFFFNDLEPLAVSTWENSENKKDLLALLQAENYFSPDFLENLQTLGKQTIQRIQRKMDRVYEQFSIFPEQTSIRVKEETRYQKAYMEIYEKALAKNRPLFAMIIFEMFLFQQRWAFSRFLQNTKGINDEEEEKVIADVAKSNEDMGPDYGKLAECLPWVYTSRRLTWCKDAPRIDFDDLDEDASLYHQELVDEDFLPQANLIIPLPEIRCKGSAVSLHVIFPSEDQRNAFSLADFSLDYDDHVKRKRISVRGHISRVTGELCVKYSNFIGMQDTFAVVDKEDIYKYLKVIILKNIYEAASANKIVRNVFIDIDSEEKVEEASDIVPEVPSLEAGGIVSSGSVDEQEAPALPETFEAVKEESEVVSREPKKRRLRPISEGKFTWFRIISAIKHYGIDIEESDHPMLVYQGSRTRFINRHSAGSPKWNKDVLIGALANIGIRWNDFINDSRVRKFFKS